MTPEHAFLQAIKAEPEDDALRLIFADWLEDNGQPERAEFIRLQVQRIRLPRGDPQHTEMKRQEVELLRTHSREWLGPLAVHPAVSCWDFRRGLLWLSVYTDQRKKGVLLADCAERSTLAWVDALKVMNLDRVAALVESPVLPFLTALELRFHLGAAGVADLGRSAHLDNLTSLNLANNNLGQQGASALAVSFHLGRLTSLNLANNHLGNKGALVLAGPTRLGNLARLDLTDNDIGPEGAAALADSVHLARLTWLNLGHNRIGTEGAAALAASPHLTNLTFLYLWGNNIGKGAAAALQHRFGDRVCL